MIERSRRRKEAEGSANLSRLPRYLGSYDMSLSPVSVENGISLPHTFHRHAPKASLRSRYPTVVEADRWVRVERRRFVEDVVDTQIELRAPQPGFAARGIADAQVHHAIGFLIIVQWV